MIADVFRQVPLSDAETLEVHEFAGRLRHEHGGHASAVAGELLRRAELAYRTANVDPPTRLRAAKRVRSLGMLTSWLSTDAAPAKPLLPEAAPATPGDGDAATLRAHILAAVIRAIVEAKKEGRDPGAVIAELKRLSTPEGLDELRDALGRMKRLGLTLEGVVWLSWERGTSMAGRTRWRNTQTGELRYQESEPGTRRAATPETAAPAGGQQGRPFGDQMRYGRGDVDFGRMNQGAYQRPEQQRLFEEMPPRPAAQPKEEPAKPAEKPQQQSAAVAPAGSADTISAPGAGRVASPALPTNVSDHQAANNVAALADHVSRMEPSEFAAAQQNLANWKVNGQPLQPNVIETVRSYAEAKVEHAQGTPSQERTPGKVYNVPTTSLNVDPERFQYKLNTDKTGVGAEWKNIKKFDPEFAGVVHAWWDEEKQKGFIVNGHHRHWLAQRDQAPTMAVRWIDAKDAKDARAKGALINIAGGRGTAVDAAKFMRDTGVGPQDLDERGVNLKAKMTEEAVALTKLSDPLFDRVARGTLDPARAVAVGRHLEDHELQTQLFKLLDRREAEKKDIPLRNVEEMAREMAATPTAEKTESSLFGDITSTESLFEQRAEVKAAIRQQLAREANTFAAVSSKARSERLGEAGNVLDTEKNKQLGQQAEEMKATYDTLVNRKGPISDAINAAAGELAKATTKGERDAAKQRAFEAVRDAASAETSRTTVGGGEGADTGLAGEAAAAATLAAPEQPGRGNAPAPGLKEPAKKPEPHAEHLASAKLFTEVERNAGSAAKMPHATQEHVYAAAEKAKPVFDEIIDTGKGLDKALGATVAHPGSAEEFRKALDTPGPIVIVAPLKGANRAAEKVAADYGGDWSRLHDSVRATVAVDTVAEIPGTMEKLRAELEARGWKVAKTPKNRFETPTPNGYRDIMINVVNQDGLIGEVQIHVKAMTKAKEDGHKLYEEQRSIEGKALLEKRDMTPEEKARHQQLDQEMAAKYNAAWQEAIGGQHGLLRPERPAGAAPAAVGDAGDSAPGRDLAPVEQPGDVPHAGAPDLGGGVPAAGARLDGGLTGEAKPSVTLIGESPGATVDRLVESNAKVTYKGKSGTVTGRSGDRATVKFDDGTQLGLPPHLLTDAEAASAKPETPETPAPSPHDKAFTKLRTMKLGEPVKIGDAELRRRRGGGYILSLSGDGAPIVGDREKISKALADAGIKITGEKPVRAPEKTGVEPVRAPDIEPKAGEDLFGGKPKPTYRAPKGEQREAFDYDPDMTGSSPHWMDAAKDFAAQLDEKVGKMEQADVGQGGRAKIGDQWYTIARAENGDWEFAREDEAAAPATTASDKPASEHAAAISEIYKRSGDVSIPFETIEATLAPTQDMSKKELLDVVEGMGFARQPRKTRAELVQSIRQFMLDRRSAAQRAKMIMGPATADEQRRFEEGDTNAADNLERPSSESDRGGVSTGEPMGANAPATPGVAVSKEGEGVEGQGPTGAVPAVADGGRHEPSVATGERRNEPGVGAGTGAGGTAGETAGRAGSADGVGAPGGGVVDRGRGESVPNPVEQVTAAEPTPDNPTDTTGGNFSYHGRDVFPKGIKSKFRANIEAIKTLRMLQAEGRDPTPEEQEVLSKYTGWGQFGPLFNRYTEAGESWAAERTELRRLLSSEDYDAAERSTTNAHYTDPSVVDAHWKIAQKLGFKGGRFLETSAGVGYYLGMMPPELAGKTKTTAVELDPTTGGMLKHLYPKANVEIKGFQDHKAPPGFYDLVASNVPFGNWNVHDPKYNKHKAKIHDYFFLKSADLVRPGGLVQHITSKGTLDKVEDNIRKKLYETCDLVSAIRFPSGAHKEGAGTDVVTDMVILRKRLPGEAPGDDSWTKVTTVPDPDGGEPIVVNKYFADHPEQILGRLDRSGQMRREGEVGVARTEDYEQRLQAAIDRLPQNVMTAAARPRKAFEPSVLPAPDEVKDGGYAVRDGKLFLRSEGALTEQKAGKGDVDRIGAMLGVRDAMREAINEQRNGKDATVARMKLNDVYDKFVQKYGFLNERKNTNLFRGDPDHPNLLALEKWDRDKKVASKADIFRKDTVRSQVPVTKAGSVPEALGVSLHEFGTVDVDHIAKLTGQKPEHVGADMVKNGLAYEDPSAGWQPADQYLCGNVRQKLALAKAAAAADPRFKPNVEALEKVQPEDIDHEDIDVKLGANWIPASDVAGFANELLGAHEGMKVKYAMGQWKADYTSDGLRRHAHGKVAQSLGTTKADFDFLLENALNGKSATIYHPKVDKDERARVDEEATNDANAKIQELKEKFKEWVWTDDERRQRLHRHYNDNFNNIRFTKYDGSHLRFPGMNPAFKPHAHIPDFVWQVITTGKGLAAHEVGMGKSAAMIMSAMELRRLGLAKKPMVACLKANVEQFTAEALRLYPGAKIISTNNMFDAKKRKETIAKIATGDYDMVIMTHDNLNALKMKPETVKKYLDEELAELEEAIVEAEREDPSKGNRITKQLRSQKEQLETRILNALKMEKKDDAVFFEDLGVDTVFLDEAHKYKTLPSITKRGRVKGIPTGRSDRATTMLMRTRWLQEQNNGRGVVFATGTPIANTMSEMFTMQRYLQPQELKERNIERFDDWANVFGDIETKGEFKVDGTYDQVSRFSKFTNLADLMQLSRQMMDVQRVDNLPKTSIQRPDRKDSIIAAPPTPEMGTFMRSLEERAKEIKARRGPPQPGDDIMLKVCTDGRKGALDMRLIDPNAKDNPQSKANLAVNNVLETWKQHPNKTQLIFCDLGINPIAGTAGPEEQAADDGEDDGTKADKKQLDLLLQSNTGFHLYADVIDKLVKGGIPREKIADFSQLKGDAKDDAQKKLRTGEMLVAIGSTDKLGTGVNVQDKVIAMHHLDCPWFPAALEQRDGRGWRHGNEAFHEKIPVQIHRYVAEGSLDKLFWQTVGTKANFIKQVMTPGETVARTMEDHDTEQLSPEMVMAAAAGDPRVLKKIDLQNDVKKLDAAQKRHHRDEIRTKDSVAALERSFRRLDESAAKVAGTVRKLDEHPDFYLAIDGTRHTDRADAEEAMKKKVADIVANIGEYGNRDEQRFIGEFRGLQLVLKGGSLHLDDPDGDQLFSTGDSLRSVETVARLISRRADEEANNATKARADAERLRAGIGKPFKQADELARKQAELKQLEEEFIKEGRHEKTAGEAVDK